MRVLGVVFSAVVAMVLLGCEPRPTEPAADTQAESAEEARESASRAYVSTMEGRLDGIEERLNRLEERVEEAGANAKAGLNEQLKSGRTKLEQTRERLDRVETETDAAWQQTKTDVDAAVQELEKSVEALESELTL